MINNRYTYKEGLNINGFKCIIKNDFTDKKIISCNSSSNKVGSILKEFAKSYIKDDVFLKAIEDGYYNKTNDLNLDLFKKYCIDIGLRVMIFSNESDFKKKYKTIKFKVIEVTTRGNGELIIL